MNGDEEFFELFILAISIILAGEMGFHLKIDIKKKLIDETHPFVPSQLKSREKFWGFIFE
jgi:hypothetical protein